MRRGTNKERGQARLPDPETIGLAYLLVRLKASKASGGKPTFLTLGLSRPGDPH